MEAVSHPSDLNDGAEIEPKRLTPINDFTTFRAEFIVEDGDIMFHFFLAPEVQAKVDELAGVPARLAAFDTKVRHYWLDSFPRSLDVVARSFFNADKDRLEASYVENCAEIEIKSWWLLAKGFANEGLSPELRAKAFCEQLDQALDALKVNLLLA